MLHRGSGTLCLPVHRESSGSVSIYVWNIDEVESKNLFYIAKVVDIGVSGVDVFPSKSLKGSNCPLFYGVAVNGSIFTIRKDGSYTENVKMTHDGYILAVDVQSDGLGVLQRAKILPRDTLKKKQEYELVYAVYKMVPGNEMVLAVDSKNILQCSSPVTEINGAGCCGTRVIVSYSNDGRVDVFDSSPMSDTVVDPLFTRQLKKSSEGKFRGKKRAPNENQQVRTDSVRGIATDSSNRAYIVQNLDAFDSMQCVCIDLKYGCILWNGVVRSEQHLSGYIKVRMVHSCFCLVNHGFARFLRSASPGLRLEITMESILSHCRATLL